MSEKHVEARRVFWESPKGAKLRAKFFEMSRKTQLAKDLQLLNTVIRELRNKLEFPEKNRQKALAAYHKNPNKADRPFDRRRQLEATYRRILKRPAEEAEFKTSELAGLRKAAQTVVERAARNERKSIRSKILRSLRRRFQNAFRHGVNFSKTIRELSGCSLQDLRQHLESQWKPGMTWENYGYEGWHIDHKRPCASFNLLDLAQQRQCFHYTNLQPLWAIDNFTKRDKIS